MKGYIMGPFKDSPFNANIKKQTYLTNPLITIRDRSFTMGGGMEGIFKKSDFIL